MATLCYKKKRNMLKRPTSKNTSKNKNKNNNDTDSDEEGDNDKNQKIERNNNHIFFHAEVDRGNIFQLISCIDAAQEFCLLQQHRLCIDIVPIYLHINSFGGSIFDAMTAIDVILASKIPIYTIIEGATASAGTLISVVGTKRFICPSAYMLIHQLSSEFWGKMNEIEDDYTNLQVLMQRIKNVYKQHTTVPKKQMNEILKHDLWWDSEKCIEFGLVDELWDH